MLFRSNLTNFTLGASVTNIGVEAFLGCGLTTIIVNTSNPAYSGAAGALLNKNQTILVERLSGTVYTIPNSVTSIGRWAFAGTGLSSVTIPNSVTSIGDDAFENCATLTSVTIGTNVTSIGTNAFSECTTLGSINLPNSLTNIGSGAFADTMVFGVTIPNSVTTIGDLAFSGTRLNSVTIGTNVTSIGIAPFAGCPLSAFTVNALNPAYCSVAGVLLNKNQSTLIEYPENKAGASYTISNSVTNIGDYAFENCFYPSNITIPSSVISIGNGDRKSVV